MTIGEDWGTGYTANIIVHASADVKGFRVRMTLLNGGSISGPAWNAETLTAHGPHEVYVEDPAWYVSGGGSFGFNVQGASGVVTEFDLSLKNEAGEWISCSGNVKKQMLQPQKAVLKHMRKRKL
jgi:hypothetical protein